MRFLLRAVDAESRLRLAESDTLDLEAVDEYRDAFARLVTIRWGVAVPFGNNSKRITTRDDDVGR